jgi:hypothetical protein
MHGETMKFKISGVSAGILFLHVEYIRYPMHVIILGIRLGIKLHKCPVSA